MKKQSNPPPPSGATRPPAPPAPPKVSAYHQTMWAVMEPDVYSDENSDQVRPRWHTHAEGDMDSDYSETVTLDSKRFPPGTKVLVIEPCCPECGMIPDLCRPDEACDFDWDAWALDEYS